MHIILAFPFQWFCKQQSHASREGNSALGTPGAQKRAPCSEQQSQRSAVLLSTTTAPEAALVRLLPCEPDLNSLLSY
jgi:hypothetical protein